MFRFRCRHRWTWYSSSIVEIYGDGFGNMTKFPTGRKTVVSGTCAKCGEPTTKAVKGTWQPPP